MEEKKDHTNALCFHSAYL